MTKQAPRVFQVSGFVIPSSFVISASSFSRRSRVARRNYRGVCIKRLTNRSGAWHKHRYIAAFTVLELLVVITIIIVLAGLILATVGYVQKKGARSRAEAEIAAMSAACESYKADNGIYPRGPATTTTIGSTTIPANVTDTLDPRASSTPTPTYSQASLYLYTQLSGDSTGSRSASGKSYMQFNPKMLLPTGGTGTVTATSDPFGNSYGYSTAQAANPGGSAGYNPTFDLWSTAGYTPAASPTPTPTPQDQWVKNW
jgi:type II secretory pathway pseudopilin PulG